MFSQLALLTPSTALFRSHGALFVVEMQQNHVQSDGTYIQIKVGISGYANLRTMSTDKWATSKSTQLSTKVWVKLLLLLENALKLNFEAL